MLAKDVPAAPGAASPVRAQPRVTPAGPAPLRVAADVPGNPRVATGCAPPLPTAVPALPATAVPARAPVKADPGPPPEALGPAPRPERLGHARRLDGIAPAPRPEGTVPVLRPREHDRASMTGEAHLARLPREIDLDFPPMRRGGGPPSGEIERAPPRKRAEGVSPPGEVQLRALSGASGRDVPVLPVRVSPPAALAARLARRPGAPGQVVAVALGPAAGLPAPAGRPTARQSEPLRPGARPAPGASSRAAGPVRPAPLHGDRRIPGGLRRAPPNGPRRTPPNGPRRGPPGVGRRAPPNGVRRALPNGGRHVGPHGALSMPPNGSGRAVRAARVGESCG